MHVSDVSGFTIEIITRTAYNVYQSSIHETGAGLPVLPRAFNDAEHPLNPLSFPNCSHLPSIVMGNRLSLQQAEYEEAEYHALVEAVERAKQRNKPHRDIEACAGLDSSTEVSGRFYSSATAQSSKSSIPERVSAHGRWSSSPDGAGEMQGHASTGSPSEVSLHPAPSDASSDAVCRHEDVANHELPTLTTPVTATDGATSIRQTPPGSVHAEDIVSSTPGSSLVVRTDVPPTHGANSLADGEDGIPITDDSVDGSIIMLRRQSDSAPSRASSHSRRSSGSQDPAEPDLFEMVKEIHEFTKRIMGSHQLHADENKLHKGRLLEEMKALQRRILDRLSLHVPSQPVPSATIEMESETRDMGTHGFSNLAFAVGLRPTRLTAPPPPSVRNPECEKFPLKAFRGDEYRCMKIEAGWDDERLLREITKTYDFLRTVWRKWFSLKGVSAITMVMADHSVIYPHRIGPTKISPVHIMRLRSLMNDPSKLRGRYEFVEALTERTDVGIEFVERFQLSRIAIAIVFPVVLSALLGIFYSIFLQDVSSAFTVAGYMTSAYSVCLVLIGVLNLVDS